MIEEPGGEAAARSALASARRVVVKIGTNTLVRPADAPGRLSGVSGDSGATGAAGAAGAAGGLDVEYIHRVACELSDLMRAGREIILVTSGAIGMGARELGLQKRPAELPMRQACAAIGQPILMDVYRRAFGLYGLATAQLLVTRDSWDDWAAYRNLRATMERLIALRVLPVFNENDTISTAEIGNAFGDNDRLSAYVASKVDAEALLILSDVDSLYDANPRENPEARPIPYVRDLDEDILAVAGGKGSEFSTGGMKTKLAAVAIARDAGCRVVIAHGREPRVISRVLAGERLGSLFDAEEALPNRRRWLKNSRPTGSISVDEGALAAIRARNSLLPAGLLGVEGVFERGAVLAVNEAAKLVSNYSSAELVELAGMRRDGSLLPVGGEPGPGGQRLRVIARPEEIVFLDD